MNCDLYSEDVLLRSKIKSKARKICDWQMWHVKDKKCIEPLFSLEVLLVLPYYCTSSLYLKANARKLVDTFHPCLWKKWWHTNLCFTAAMFFFCLFFSGTLHAVHCHFLDTQKCPLFACEWSRIIQVLGHFYKGKKNLCSLNIWRISLLVWMDREE